MEGDFVMRGLRLGLGLPAASATASSPYAAYALALDFKNGAYWRGGSQAASLSAITGYSYSRGGIKAEPATVGVSSPFAANTPAVVSGVGYYSDAQYTNQLLNAGSSANLSTQNVTVTAQAYTLSFYGTGTVTLSGTSTAGPLVGTGVNNRVTLTFTPTAGTLTLTVTGTVQYAGLMSGSSLPGPIIPTTASGVTVASDALNLGPVLSTDVDFAGWVVLNVPNGGTDVRPLVLGTGNDRILLSRNASNLASAVVISGGSTVYSATLGTGLTIGRLALLIRRKAGKWSLACKDPAGTVSIATETTAAFPTTFTTTMIGQSVGANQPNGALEFVGVKPGTFTDTDLTAILTAA